MIYTSRIIIHVTAQSTTFMPGFVSTAAPIIHIFVRQQLHFTIISHCYTSYLQVSFQFQPAHTEISLNSIFQNTINPIKLRIPEWKLWQLTKPCITIHRQYKIRALQQANAFLFFFKQLTALRKRIYTIYNFKSYFHFYYFLAFFVVH